MFIASGRPIQPITPTSVVMAHAALTAGPRPLGWTWPGFERQPRGISTWGSGVKTFRAFVAGETHSRMFYGNSSR